MKIEITLIFLLFIFMSAIHICNRLEAAIFIVLSAVMHFNPHQTKSATITDKVYNMYVSVCLFVWQIGTRLKPLWPGVDSHVVAIPQTQTFQKTSLHFSFSQLVLFLLTFPTAFECKTYNILSVLNVKEL